MKYAVDKIEGDIVVLENISTNNIKYVNLKTLPYNIKEGTILKYYNKEYIIDIEEKNIREKRIKDKLERLKNLNKGD